MFSLLSPHAHQISDLIDRLITVSVILALVTGFAFVIYMILNEAGWPKDWREGKIFLYEDLLVFGSVIALNFAYDFIAHAFNRTYPIKFGIGQLIILITFGFLFARKWKQREFFK